MKKLSSNEERDLILKLKENDLAAFEKIYKSYSADLIAYSRRFVKSDGLCEEIVHDVFLKYWDHRHTLREDQLIRPYLYTICKNHVLNTLRAISQDRVRAREWIKENSIQQESLPEESVYEEYRELAFEAISRLPRQRQLVFKLCKLEGKSYDEVASILKISKGTINDHIIKANKSIKQYLQSQKGYSYEVLAIMIIFF